MRRGREMEIRAYWKGEVDGYLEDYVECWKPGSWWCNELDWVGEFCIVSWARIERNNNNSDPVVHRVRIGLDYIEVDFLTFKQFEIKFLSRIATYLFSTRHLTSTFHHLWVRLVQ